jgi:hypothetical protein
MKTINWIQEALLIPASRVAKAVSGIVLTLLLLLLSGTASFAQCDKDLILTSSKTEYLDAQGALQRTQEEHSTIEISKTEVTITPGNDPRMKGTIKSHTCNWKVPFKEGKSVIQATFNDEQKGTMNATITIEGKDGGVILLLEAVEMPDRKIRVPIDKFEEKS